MQIIFFLTIFNLFTIRNYVQSNKPEDHPNWPLLKHDLCGESMSDRIIGGKNASLGQYPWLVRIGYKNETNNITFRCGGVIINEIYVVTAAHCSTELPRGLRVSTIRCGELNTDTEIDCEGTMCAEPIQDIGVKKVLVHKEYDTPKYSNDIALVRLATPIKFNGWVMPICIPFGKLLEKDYIGELGEVAGWGFYDLMDKKPSVILQHVKLPIIDLSECKEIFRRHAVLSVSQMCVGGKLGEDSCGGDSGGPLMKVDALNGPPKYFFIGIVSFGASRCGSTTKPAVYTRISSYVEWILDNMVP